MPVLLNVPQIIIIKKKICLYSFLYIPILHGILLLDHTNGIFPVWKNLSHNYETLHHHYEIENHNYEIGSYEKQSHNDEKFLIILKY